MANILFNKESGLAEQLQSPEQVQAALAAGTHEIPLVSPDGEMGSVDQQSASDLMAQGYQQPNEQQLQKSLRHAAYSGPIQEMRASGLGVLEGHTPIIGHAIAKTILGEEDVNALREESPNAYAAGQALGLGVGAATGTGIAGIMGKAGAAVESAIGATSIMGKIGSVAAREAAENMIFQAGDELGRGLTNDPHVDVESAIAHIGLSGLIGGVAGGAIGSVPELWKLGPGKKVDELLNTLKNKPTDLPDVLKTADINMPSEVSAVFGDSPKATEIANELMDSGSKSGDQFRASIDKVKQNISEAAPELIGRTSDDISKLHSNSKYELGQEVQEHLANTVRKQIEPIETKFAEFESKFSKQALAKADTEILQNAAGDLKIALGVDKMPSSASARMFNRLETELPLQQTVEDLRRYSSNLAKENPFGSESYYAAKQMRASIDEAIENVIEKRVSVNAPNLLADWQTTKSQYGEFKGLLGELNDRLHLGKSAEGGKAGFLRSLSEMNPEKIIDRLNLKNDVGLQNLLAEKFPEVAALAQKESLNAVIKKSLNKEGSLDVNKLVKQINELSPELRNYLLPKEAQSRISALGDLMSKLPTGMNSSKTAGALDKMWKHMPASASAMAAWMTGNNPFVGGLLGQLMHYMSREVPDAGKLAMLKFLGSNQATSAAGLNAAIQTISATIKGEAKLAKMAKAVYSGTMPVLAKPSQADREKLDKQIEHLVANRNDAMGIGGDTGHYLPDHAASMGLASARVISYLQSLKPNTAKLGLLNPKTKPSSSELAVYNRALDLAQQPLLILADIKNGTVTSGDLKHLNAMYPSLALNMAKKLQMEMIDAVHDGLAIPYRTKIGLSLVLNQPLESSLNAANIVAAQPQPAPGPAPSATSMSGLKKISSLYETKQQRRELGTRRH
jgi:gas vesicle protein